MGDCRLSRITGREGLFTPALIRTMKNPGAGVNHPSRPVILP